MSYMMRIQEKILAVDPGGTSAAELRRLLSGLPLAVEHIGGVQAGMASLRQGRVALVVGTEQHLAGEGRALLWEVQQNLVDVGLVAIADTPDAETLLRCLRLGVWDVLFRPLSTPQLLDCLERVEARRGLQRASANAQHLRTLAADRNRILQRRSTELLATQRALLRSFCQMAEFRDPETGNHLLRMAHYARLIASHLITHDPAYADVSPQFPDRLYEAAPLHDIGKVGIPDAVLLKKGPLTPDERTIMETHPMLGGRAIDAIRAHLPPGMDKAYLDMAEEVATCHHERFDGTGYPRRLRGEDIPLSARVVSVADFYDACSSPRVYRPVAMPHEEVCRMVVALSGKAFDPAVVQAFLACEPEVLRVRHELADGTHALSTPPVPLIQPV